MGKVGTEWAKQFSFSTGFKKRAKCDPNDAETVIFLEKSKNHTATRASPPDHRLYEMIELQHSAQHATQSRHFSNKKNFNFQVPPLAKSWLQACLWACRRKEM